MNYLFEHAERIYANTTPIRGQKKAKDIRPLGKRYKQWERIVKIDDDIYAFRLYNTDVVIIHRDGTMFINTGGWISNTTTRFINEHVPTVYASRSYNHIWVTLGNQKFYPVPRTGLQFKDGELATDLKVYKRVINKERAKELRKPTKDFIEFARVMIPIIDWSAAIERTYFSARSLLYVELSRDSWVEQLMIMQNEEWVWGKGYEYKAPTLAQVREKVNSYLYDKYQPYDFVEAPLGVVSKVILM